MLKIIVVSDTHGRTENLEKIMPVIDSSDIAVHLGDGDGDLYAAGVSRAVRVIEIKGNCDWFSHGHSFFVYEGEGVKLLFTHGHDFGVKTDLSRLSDFAAKNGCDAAFFGHTHTAYDQIVGGVRLINPGSLSLPREGCPSYAYVIINAGKTVCKTVPVY